MKVVELEFAFRKGEAVLVSDDRETWYPAVFKCYSPDLPFPYEVYDCSRPLDGFFAYKYCKKWEEEK